MRNLIPGLARPLARLLRTDERGAIGMLIGILIGGGVLLGMGALVVDIGFLYSERAQLQNGADAAAFAVGKGCVTTGCVAGDAQPVANLNANDNKTSVDLVCGSDPALGGGCPAPTGAMTDCPGPPSDGNSYVDVHTSTLRANGSTVIPPFLGRALLNNGGYSGTTVRACAQVEYGPAISANSLAMTISLCSWEGLTGDTDFTTDSNEGPAGSPDGDSDDDASGYNTPIPVYLKGQAKTCADQGSGLNAPGAFDWLNTDTDNDGENNSDTDNDGDASGSCNAYVNVVSKTTYNNSGNNVSQACQLVLEQDVTSYEAGNPVTVFLPVFDTSAGTGANVAYHVVGLAGFVVMGFTNMPYNPQSDGTYDVCLTSASGSGLNAPCIEGYFTPGLDPVGPIGSGSSDFGADRVRLSG